MTELESLMKVVGVTRNSAETERYFKVKTHRFILTIIVLYYFRNSDDGQPRVVANSKMK